MSSDWIRVSCASLCRIEHQGRFLLLLNANRRGRGIYVLGPIGGALRVHNEAIWEHFGAIPEDPATHDLRMTLPYQQLPAFREWFYSGNDREQSPFRELREELVHESGLLPALAPEDVRWRRLWTIEEEAFTMRQGQTGLLTHYFLEIFDVTFTTEAQWARLLTLSPEVGAAWVTTEQVDQRETIWLSVDGMHREVTVNGALLLGPPANESD